MRNHDDQSPLEFCKSRFSHDPFWQNNDWVRSGNVPMLIQKNHHSFQICEKETLRFLDKAIARNLLYLFTAFCCTIAPYFAFKCLFKNYTSENLAKSPLFWSVSSAILLADIKLIKCSFKAHEDRFSPSPYLEKLLRGIKDEEVANHFHE